MKSQFARTLTLLLAFGLLADALSFSLGSAQAQNTRRNRGNNNTDNNQGNKAPAVKLPDDPRLLELHKALVRDAEKIAIEYQKTKQLDKARVIYGEIIRFVPTYGKAANALQTIRGPKRRPNARCSRSRLKRVGRNRDRNRRRAAESYFGFSMESGIC